MSAPPARPEYVAIQPACRPITSTTITRSWLSAVVCKRSIASVAICTAVWKPNVKSVAERSLSIVFGTPTTRIPSPRKLVRDTERVLAADRDHARRCRRARTRREHARRSVVGLERVRTRGPEDRAAAGRSPRVDASVSAHRLALDEPAPAVPVADDLVPVVPFTLAHDRADHRVEPRAVTATGEHADPHRDLL